MTYEIRLQILKKGQHILEVDWQCPRNGARYELEFRRDLYYQSVYEKIFPRREKIVVEMRAPADGIEEKHDTAQKKEKTAPFYESHILQLTLFFFMTYS